jgi:Ca-activated chloride channel homolog
MKSRLSSRAKGVAVAVLVAGVAAAAMPSLLRVREGMPPMSGIRRDTPPRPMERPAPPGPPVQPLSAPPATAQPRRELEKGVDRGVANGVVGAVLGGLGYIGDVKKQMSWRDAPMNTEAYAFVRDNTFQAVATSPLSTFSIDVDTASYANVRRFLNDGVLPPPDAVRIEELINYFRFDYPQPEGDAPFAVVTSASACPWKPEHRLVHIGLQARSIEDHALPARNLVFLLDVSGSMEDPNKLPLVQSSMGLLVDQLRESDRVAIVVYAGAAGLVLPPTTGDRKGEIKAAIASLHAGGSTAGGAGIELAYRVAADAFVQGGVNRVILATDGDFNVGVSSPGALVRLIEEKRKTGVFLSVLGFGMGNLKDSTMEQLADAGNGNYAYVDSLAEARKVLVTEGGGTLVTVAKDVKIQVEFDPAAVAAYRLIGYENRILAHEDFNDDARDAGDIGAGHTVTALYEVVPAGVPFTARGVDPLKYQGPRPGKGAATGELATVKLRYKEPDGHTSALLERTIHDDGAMASADLSFAAAVAEFGMLLRASEHRGTSSYAQALELGRAGAARDPGGHRAEFVRLVERAQRLAGTKVGLVGS